MVYELSVLETNLYQQLVWLYSFILDVRIIQSWEEILTQGHIPDLNDVAIWIIPISFDRVYQRFFGRLALPLTAACMWLVCKTW